MSQIDLPEYYCRANDAKSKPGTAMFSKQVGPVHMRVHVGDLMWTSSRTLGMGKCDSAVRQSGGASASFHVPVLRCVVCARVCAYSNNPLPTACGMGCPS